jgi:hypothetical protein
MSVRPAPTGDAKDALIAKLQAENADLMDKLRRAKALLIKLDAKMKLAKEGKRENTPFSCPACGFSADLHSKEEDDQVLKKVHEDIRASRVSRVAVTMPPPQKMSPRANRGNAPGQSSPRRLVGPPPEICHFSRLPFRAVFVLADFCDTRSLGALSCANREWKTNVLLFKQNDHAIRLGLGFYYEEQKYRLQLQQVWIYVCCCVVLGFGGGVFF